jgi:hypothetical protein
MLTVYYPGGYEPAATSPNRAEQWDLDTSTYTSWNPDGSTASQRPLTPEEVAALTAEQRAAQASTEVASAQQRIDTLHTDLPAQQAQIQADVQTVTAGWQTLTADQQTQIMLRVLNGFGNIVGALVAHATVTGAIPPG